MKVFLPNACRFAVVTLVLLVLWSPIEQANAKLPDKLSVQSAENLVGKIAFEVKAEPLDPFNPVYQTGADPKKLLQLRPGQTFLVTVNGAPLDGNYTYPIQPPQPGMSRTKLSRLEYYQPGEPGLRVLPGVTESASKAKDKNEEGVIEFAHVHPFTWTQQVAVASNTAPGIQTLYVVPRLMVCDKNSCTDPNAVYPPLKVDVEVIKSTGELTPELQKKLADGKAPESLSAGHQKQIQDMEPQLAAAKARAASRKKNNQVIDIVPPVGEENLGSLLVAAFLGAFLMLLTPCVFPMIPITVNFFLKQSERKHHNPLVMACVYSGTIVVLLTLVMLSLGNFVIWMANNAIFNLVMGGVLIVFALSLFGMFELQLPSGLARFTSAREGQGGYIGALFMALTFTITSFTCTGPFLGAMLGGIASTRPPLHHLILGSLVYSITFAAPFFVLALFPSVLKKLPKSGGWMNVVKVSMAFIEIAAAMKFLSIADAVLSPGNPRFFNYDTVLCAWIALSVALGLYLIGAYRFPHDDVAEHIGVPRMMFAVFFIGLAIYMTPALFGAKPLGVVGENIVAFLPLKSGTGEWHLDYETAWREAKEQKKLIFIDFTGVNCQNCRDNETNIFPDPRVKSLLKNYVVVQLYTDSVPIKGLDPAKAEQLAEKNARLRDALGNPTNPYYFIFEPGDTPFTKDDQLNGRPLGSRNGKIFNIEDFVRFLERRPGAATVASAK